MLACTCYVCIISVLVVISHTSGRCVILHMSVITQSGNSALIKSTMEGRTKVVVELVKAGANMELQNTVGLHCTCTHSVYLCYVY